MAKGIRKGKGGKGREEEGWRLGEKEEMMGHNKEGGVCGGGRRKK